MNKNKSKGVLIIAVGHENYKLMAVNLAASIRVNDPGLQIALATDQLTPAGKIFLTANKLVDHFVQVPHEFYTHRDKTAYIKVKIHMLDLSPFQYTLFLDCDQILCPHGKLSPVFDELQDVDLTLSNTGPAGSSIWADINEAKKLYQKDPKNAYWNFHSEFFYFNSSKVAQQYFKAAQKVYNDGKIKSATQFGGAPMADELAFQCASMITGTYPHQANWLPNFWFDRDQRESRKYPYQLTQFITYSIGGNNVPGAVKNNYNILARSYFAKLGLSNAYQVVDKKYFTPGRKNN